VAAKPDPLQAAKVATPQAATPKTGTPKATIPGEGQAQMLFNKSMEFDFDEEGADGDTAAAGEFAGLDEPADDDDYELVDEELDDLDAAFD